MTAPLDILNLALLKLIHGQHEQDDQYWIDSWTNAAFIVIRFATASRGCTHETLSEEYYLAFAEKGPVVLRLVGNNLVGNCDHVKLVALLTLHDDCPPVKLKAFVLPTRRLVFYCFCQGVYLPASFFLDLPLNMTSGVLASESSWTRSNIES